MKLLLFTIFFGAMTLARWVNGAQLHVFLNGNDAGSGSEDQPFATLTRARDVARANRLTGETVSVIVHGGINRLEKTLEFSAVDSGTAQTPMVWKAAPGEKVRIVGGLVIPADAIKPVTEPAILNRVISVEVRSRLQQIDLSALGIQDLGQIGRCGFLRL